MRLSSPKDSGSRKSVLLARVLTRAAVHAPSISRGGSGAQYVVDNGFAVAWDASLDYRITRAKRIRSFLFADQLLMRFSGHGRLWAQSRSSAALANWIHPYRRVQKKRNSSGQG